MARSFTVELHGLPELRKKLNDEYLYAQASRHILGHTAEKIAGTAQSRAPSGINVTSRVSKREPPRSAVVRVANTGLGKKARAIHGPIRNPKERTAPYTPNPEGIAAWAAQHGVPVAAVVKSAQRRGTPFKPFMREGLDANKGAAQSALGAGERMVEAAWNR